MSFSKQARSQASNTQNAPFWQSQTFFKPQVLLLSDNVWEHAPKPLCPDKEQSVLESNAQSTAINQTMLDTALRLFQTP